MKKILTDILLKREWLLYLMSFVLAYILTVILFLTLNSMYDITLRTVMSGDSQVAKDQRTLAFKYHHLINKTAWSNDQDKNNERFVEVWYGLEDSVRNTSEASLLTSLMLYGNGEVKNYGESRESFLLPYIASPNVSLNDIMKKLDWAPLKNYFGEEGVDNVKRFFSQELSDQLDQLQATPAYTNRRYLNGSIQFITFLVAFVGVIMLLSFMGSIWVEKQSLKEGIASFDIPQNIDNYQIGQLEETMTKLREQQAERSSSLREMLINTISTFSWRGKEEAEHTLSLEIQELRENMDSRFGMIKYFAWAVPSIGFIGTVVGIGDALGNAHNVIGQTAEYQTKGQIQLITGQLGIAFDTTLISLLLSIVLVLLIHVLTRREEHLISSAVSTVKRELLQKIAPLERANKLRRYNLLLESLRSHTSPAELQAEPFVTLKRHLEDELNSNNHG